jgi:uncharacterized protein DUF488
MKVLLLFNRRVELGVEVIVLGDRRSTVHSLYQILFIYAFPDFYSGVQLLTIKIERIYDNPKGIDSFRVLVDRLWPRGLRIFCSY